MSIDLTRPLVVTGDNEFTPATYPARLVCSDVKHAYGWSVLVLTDTGSGEMPMLFPPDGFPEGAAWTLRNAEGGA